MTAYSIPRTMKACVLTGPNAYEIRDDVPYLCPDGMRCFAKSAA